MIKLSNDGRPPLSQQQVVRAHCQANVNRNDELDVCGKPATEAVVENGDYVPVCEHHAMIARRNHWAVGRLRPNDKLCHAAESERGAQKGQSK